MYVQKLQVGGETFIVTPRGRRLVAMKPTRRGRQSQCDTKQSTTSCCESAAGGEPGCGEV